MSLRLSDTRGQQRQGGPELDNSTLPSQMSSSPPSTPQRGRSTSRYPASLARGDPGRVPLHRRGTSKTYERLEDLLREAGYKETRIFTPESERAEERRKGSVRGGVDSVMGYLASWMQGSGRGENSSETLDGRPGSPVNGQQERSTWSLPPSPLAHKRKLEGQPRPRSPLCSPSASTTTLTSLTSGSSDGRTVSNHHYYHARKAVPPPQLLRPQSSVSGNLRTYAQVSAAQVALRHMASTPSMQKHPSSSPRHTDERMTMYLGRSVQPQPALPARWMDAVAKAVVGSGHPHAHVGGPHATNRHSSRPSSRRPRAKRDGKHTLVDQTNRPSRSVVVGRSASGVPPGLTSYLSPAGVAPSEVSTTRVMCRSAPASRSSSRVGDRNNTGSLRGQARQPARRQSKVDGVPMLSSTCVENDAWGTQWVNGRRVPLSLTGFVVDGQTFDVDNERTHDEHHDDDDDDDDDDGELDFARLLVPPKRQYSIQSLRKHLHHSRSNLRESARAWDDDQEFGTRERGNCRGAIDEDEGHGWEAAGVPGFADAPTKQRRGLPRAWANLA